MAPVDEWKLMKRARFNAATRMERKQSAGGVTLAIVALYGGLISIFIMIFKHRVGGDTRDLLEFVAVVSSWLTLIIGLTEQQKNHGANARELHDCARDINDVQKQLTATPIYDPAQLVPFLQRYNEIIRACHPNHGDVDYALAEAAGTRELSRDTTAQDRVFRRHRRKCRLAYLINTYWFYVIIWFTPAIVGFALWLVVPASDSP